jgi:serine/threonine-protein kinase
MSKKVVAQKYVPVIGQSGNTYQMEISKPLSQEGAMSKIYRAERELASGKRKEVAIKVLRKEFKTNSMYLERFRQESDIRFSHPNVVEIYDYIEDKNTIQNTTQYGIVMEFLDGESVKQRIDRNKSTGKTFPEKETLKIAKQVLQGLRALHMQYDPIYHRDVKPGNIMICKDGIVKIIDFGISKVDTVKVDNTLTRIGTKVRTPLYAAPEQTVSGKPVGAWTDIYSLGITCYEMITGEPPYNSEEDDELEQLIRKKTIPSHPKIKDKRVLELLKKATAKAPKDRFADAIEFIQAIDKILYNTNNEQQVGRTLHGKNIFAVLSVVLSVVLLLLFLLLLIR